MSIDGSFTASGDATFTNLRAHGVAVTWTGNNTYYPLQPYPDQSQVWNGVPSYPVPYQFPQTSPITIPSSHISQFLGKIPGQPEAPVSTRGLYEVFVVEPQSGGVVLEKRLVADSQENARLKALRALDEAIDVDDVDVIVRMIGSVRAKNKPIKVVVEK